MIKVIIKNQEIDFHLTGLRKIGRGGEGDIYLLSHGGENYAVKIYYKPSQEKHQKIKAMLANNPADAIAKINNMTFVQLSWPSGLCFDSGRFCGFVMPYVDLAHSSTLDFYLDRRLYEEKFSHAPLLLTYKIEIARNLSNVIKSLHSKNHYFIDFKPQNVRVYDRYHLISLIDCDGFNISAIDGVRYPAKSYSSEYISPIALRNNSDPGSLGLSQDLFALAVVIFQLLNYGIHPFSGLIAQTDNTNTTDDKVAKGYYPYGIIANSKIKPLQNSAHQTFPDELRKLFDRAFNPNSSSMPTVDEWVSYLEMLLKDRLLVKCKTYPTNPEHIHFEGKDCPACMRSNMSNRIRVKSKVPSLSASSKKSSPWTVSPSFQSPPSTAYQVGNKLGKAVGSTKDEFLGINKIIWAAAAGIMIFVLFIFLFKSNSSNNLNSPGPAPSIATKVRNPVIDIEGTWKNGENCKDQSLKISAWGDFGGQIKGTYLDSSKNWAETIKYAEKKPNDLYELTIEESSSKTIEVTYKLLGKDQIKLWKLISYNPSNPNDTKEASIINGKNIEKETDSGVIDRCPN